MTTRPPPENYLKLWQAAAEQEIGMHITCVPEDQAKLVNMLYECRNTFGGFEELSIFQPQPPGTIYICKRALDNLPEAIG